MIIKNSYKNKEKLPFVPYVYFIRHIPSGIWYIGSKFAKSANPLTFLKTYFTSSTIIQELLATSELSDVEYKIIKTFNNIEETVNYESRLLIKTHAVKNYMSANRDDCQQPNKTIQCLFLTRKISNPQSNKCITVKLETPLPPGWIEGNINLKNRQTRTNWKWWYDPITEESTMLPSNAEGPEGWINSRPKSHSNSETLTGKYKCITDGIEFKLILASEEIPGGWRRGKIKSKSEKIANKIANEKTKGCIYINDGEKTIRLNPGLPIPPGWIKGHLTLKKIHQPRVCVD